MSCLSDNGTIEGSIVPIKVIGNKWDIIYQAGISLFLFQAVRRTTLLWRSTTTDNNYKICGNKWVWSNIWLIHLSLNFKVQVQVQSRWNFKLINRCTLKKSNYYVQLLPLSFKITSSVWPFTIYIKCFFRNNWISIEKIKQVVYQL